MKRIMVSVAAVLFVNVLASAAVGQDLAPGDNLVVEGVPAIPLSLVEHVGRYTQFRAASIARPMF